MCTVEPACPLHVHHCKLGPFIDASLKCIYSKWLQSPAVLWHFKSFKCLWRDFSVFPYVGFLTLRSPVCVNAWGTDNFPLFQTLRFKKTSRLDVYEKQRLLKSRCNKVIWQEINSGQCRAAATLSGKRKKRFCWGFFLSFFLQCQDCLWHGTWEIIREALCTIPAPRAPLCLERSKQVDSAVWCRSHLHTYGLLSCLWEDCSDSSESLSAAPSDD